MRLYKRGPVWWFSLEFEGRRHQQSTKVKNKVKAEGIASSYRTKLAEGRVDIIQRKQDVPLLAAAMKAFLAWSKVEHRQHPATYRRYVVSSKPLLAFMKFKGKTLDKITSEMLDDYKAHRLRQSGKRTKRPIKPATVNRELACLKAMFFHALMDRYDFKNPLSKIMVGKKAVTYLEEDNTQDRVLSYEEQQKYLSAAGSTLKDIASLILETGMRPEEVYRIQIENVVPDQGYLKIPFGKTKAAKRDIPLNAAALEILIKRMKAAKGVCLFPHRKDENKPMLKANNAHDRAVKKSKVRKFRLYDLRHTWATRAAQGGMDMPTLAALLGHSRLIMISRYVHPQGDHQMEAVKKLEKINAARQIAEFEKKNAARKTAATISATVPENPPIFEGSENEGKPNRIN